MNEIIRTAKTVHRMRGLRVFVLLVALLLIALLGLRTLMPGSAGDYQITEIRSQGNTLFLRSLNDKGQAAGSIRGPGRERAIIWDADTGITKLATPDGYFSLALDVNNPSEVCGELRDPNDRPRVCFWDSEGRMYDVGTLGGPVSMALKLNDKGQVVGWAQTTASKGHGFLWSRELGIRDIDT